MDILGWTIMCIVTTACIVRASEHRCTFIKAKLHTVYTQVYKPCKLSYRARCTWFSLDYCTFYHEQFCTKQFNKTDTIYRTVTECCKNYIEAPNRTCVALAKVKNDKWYIMRQNATTESPIYVDPNDIKPIKNTDVDDDSDETDPSIVTKVNDKDGGMTLSHGAYAGIGCALLFIAVIGVLTFIGIRKRQRRYAVRKSSHGSELRSQKVPINTQEEEPEA